MPLNPNAIIESRRRLNAALPKPIINTEDAAEGGCGVVGLASEVPIAGRHLFKSLEQMRNRGNGKGGGVAMVGLDPLQFGVDQSTLDTCYLYAIAYLDAEVRAEVEARYIRPFFDIVHAHEMPSLDNWQTELPALEVQPPDAVCYFVTPKMTALAEFEESAGLSKEHFSDEEALIKEFVYQNTHRLNLEFYAGAAGTQAFVLSHGRNILILKIVGYAEDVIRFYRLNDVTAHVWIGHHRYPTRGRVTHPGGAHPFGQGIDAALVHNGDFSNYVAVKDYLGQRGMEPLFLTDTEVAALAYDLHHRVYGYPLEYVIESLAPTSELDYVMLPEEKQQVYAEIQKTHIHGSPDGPWFFIIAEAAASGHHRLLGITDTSMLRPQVFAYQRGEVGIAFCASEKQVIDAVLESLAAEDSRFWRRCDRYWNARGGSYTDGGAFIFDVMQTEQGRFELTMSDKFGSIVDTNPSGDYTLSDAALDCDLSWESALEQGGAKAAFDTILDAIPDMDWPSARALLAEIVATAKPDQRSARIELLKLLLDRRYDVGSLRPSLWLDSVETDLMRLLGAAASNPCSQFVGQRTPRIRPEPEGDAQTIIIDARPYPIEGVDSLAREIVAMHKIGWRRFVISHCRGHRFIGNGLGPGTADVRIDVFGAAGDYLGSGNDGATIHMHGNGQDQIGQIHGNGSLVVHGDVGQCYGYGAKGGELFVRGNAAGRPMINSVGSPKVVINGTALDYLAESFMAGDPLDEANPGGFVIVNGIEHLPDGKIVDLNTPYPGGNLFSLSSGGAIYVRDPHQRLSESQLNGGEFVPLGDADWNIIRPLLEKNEKHFGIPLSRLLTIEGETRSPLSTYRKIIPLKNKALSVEAGWAGNHD